MNSATKAYAEYVQGTVDSNETVKVYENRMRSNWREAGWKTDSEDVHTKHAVRHGMGRLRPGLKARIKPFPDETGRFSSTDELVKKAEDVEIKSNPNRDRDRRAQPAPTAEKGGKDKKRPHPSSSASRDPIPAAPTQSTGSSSSRTKLHPHRGLSSRQWQNAGNVAGADVVVTASTIPRHARNIPGRIGHRIKSKTETAMIATIEGSAKNPRTPNRQKTSLPLAVPGQA